VWLHDDVQRRDVGGHHGGGAMPAQQRVAGVGRRQVGVGEFDAVRVGDVLDAGADVGRNSERAVKVQPSTEVISTRIW
jgi:hypothetical protein